jgi:hypothetical protein
MKRAAPILAAIAITATTVGASAHERCRRIDTDIYECSPTPEKDEPDDTPRLNESGSLEVHLAFVSFSPFIANKHFTGSGTPLGGTGTASFSASGKDLGYLRPRTYGGEVDVAYLRRWVRFGGFVGFSMLSPDANPTSTDAATTVGGGSLSMIHAGLDAALIFPFDRVRLGVGAAFGGYFFDLPLHGFEPTTCRGRPCYQQATAAVGFAQPRLSLDVDLLGEESPMAASLGGFVGVDVANEHSIAWGVTLSLHEPQTSLAP